MGMPIDLNTLYVFRIIHIQNLRNNLRGGLFCKNSGRSDSGFVSIGSNDVISRRDSVIVRCYPDTVVNDYVPFYFSVRTPMLLNIISGYGVPALPQENIIYLCCKLTELTEGTFQWCYTNGNAATTITNFYNSLQNLDKNVDWHSIRTKDFRDENDDGDEDRVRKKHAEFLVKDHVPVKYIKGIAVINDNTKNQVEAILNEFNLDIEVRIKPGFYFL